ncbi:hypothetical protein V6N13_130077 [Hibiscus sabdariffa]
MDASRPNEPIDMDASGGDGFESVHLGWDDEVVDDGSYESQENSSEYNWLGGGHLLSDDDDEEINSIKTKFRFNEIDENEVTGNELARDEVDGNEAIVNEKNWS